MAPSDAIAQEWAEDIVWFWDTWSTPFGQGRPEMLIGSPDTISRRIEEAAGTFDLENVVLLIPQGIHEWEQVVTSLDLLATKVLPRFS